MLNKKEFLIKVCKIAKDSPCGGLFLIVFLFIAAPVLPDFAIYILLLLPLWAVGWVLYEALAGNWMKSVCVAAAFSLSVYAFFYGASENIKTGVYAGVLLTYMWCGVLVLTRLRTHKQRGKELQTTTAGESEKENDEMRPIIAGEDLPAGGFPEFWILLGLSMALVYAVVCVVVAEKWFLLTSLFALNILFGIVANWFFPISKFSGGPLMIFDKPGDINTEARKGMRISIFFTMLLGVILLDSRMLFEEGMHRDAVINLSDGFLLGKIWAITAAFLMIFLCVWLSIGRLSNERILWIRYVFSVSVILFGIFTWLLVYYLLGNEEPGARKYWFYSSILAFGFFITILAKLIYLLKKNKTS